MADISKISPDAGTTEYNVKDATARSDIASIVEKIPVNASSSNKFATEADIASAYHAAGTKTVAELLSSLLVAANEGNVYNMTDAGTTTADFIEGAGKPIRIGDNVGVCKVGNDYKFDLLSGFIDTSNFVEKSSTSGLLKNDGTVDTTSYVEAETGKGLSTNDYDATAKGIVDSIPLTVSQLQGSLLEKFPRAEQRVLGAWNILPYPEGFRAVIASNGTISADGSMYCSNYLRIESELFFSFTSKTNECYIRAAYYDSSYNFISRPIIEFAGSTFTKLTIPSNAKYVRFCFEDDTQSVTEPMVCISSSDLSYISHAKSNKQLTELIATKESAVSTEKTVAYNQNFLIKSGNVVQLILLIGELTATENEAIATIPLGYRPKKDLRFTNLNSPSQFFLASTEGYIRSMQAISTPIFTSLYTTWITP